MATAGPLSLSLSSSMALAPQDGTPAKITANVTGNSGAVTLAISGLPTGTVSNVAQQSGSSSGAITVTSSASTPAGTYTLKITATDAASASASQNLTLVVAVAGMVGATVDQTQGVNGKLQQFMSTSFQPAEWDFQYFNNHPDVTPLTTLGPQHIRIQALSKAIPMKANSNPQQATDWDFTMLDDVVQPILSAADHSPEFQIAVTPSFFDLPSPLASNDPNLQLFASYCANLVIAAWRPYVFSQLGKAGNQALYHWDYDADAQFGEVDFNTGSKHLSYWVDYWLAQMYPQTPAPPDILSLTITETTTVETIATKNSDGSVLLMVADRAVLSPSDNNGTGDARTVILDISALGNFTSASQLNIGATSDLTNGPQPAPLALASKLTVTLPGYGVSFLLLKP